MLYREHIQLFNLKFRFMDTKKEKRVNSLNEVLPDFYVEDLEKRLETDPLLAGGLVDVDSSSDACIIESTCNGDGGCTEKSSCLGHW